MGHSTNHTIVYVGLARLPRPLATAAPALVVELEVELRRRRIVAADTNLLLPGLSRLLRSVLVGRAVDAPAGAAALELEVRCAAPYAAALRTAVLKAMRAASEPAPLTEQALSLGRQDAGPLYHAGMMAYDLGHDDAARTDLERALGTNPPFSLLRADDVRRTPRALPEGEALAEAGDEP